MTRSGIFGATALSLSLAIAAPALAQHEPGGRAGAHVSGAAGMRAGGMRAGGAPQANFRSPQAGGQANFRSGQANAGATNFAGRTNAQMAQRGNAQFAQPQPGGGGE